MSAVTDVMLSPVGRGPWKYSLLRDFADAPLLRDLRPSVTVLSFA